MCQNTDVRNMIKKLFPDNSEKATILPIQECRSPIQSIIKIKLQAQIGDHQGGRARKGLGTANQILRMNDVLTTRYEFNTWRTVLLIDFAKAYNSIKWNTTEINKITEDAQEITRNEIKQT